MDAKTLNQVHAEMQRLVREQRASNEKLFGLVRALVPVLSDHGCVSLSLELEAQLASNDLLAETMAAFARENKEAMFAAMVVLGVGPS